MPRATNERLAACGAIGGLALVVKDIAHIAVLESRGKRDLPRVAGLRGFLACRSFGNLMERREVKRHTVSQIC